MQINMRDAAAGALFVAVGGIFALGATRLNLGTAFQMGPGYFPLVLSMVLMGLGAAIAIGSVNGGQAAKMRLAGRGALVVVITPIIFGLTVRGLGLLPSIALISFLSIFASQHASLKRALLLAIGLTAFCVAIFHYGLGLPIPLFGRWLG